MGYIRIVGAGKSAVSTYVIRKRIAGKQFEISTRRNTADAAVVEYRRFERDPYGYNPLPAPTSRCRTVTRRSRSPSLPSLRSWSRGTRAGTSTRRGCRRVALR
jgi:hypothetical protein